jgi:hypothetical protein
MSSPIRIALVAEGPTDKIVLESALTSILDGRSFILKQLQPEESVPFCEIGTGWVGVYRWCQQSVARSNGALRRDILYFSYDVLILQLDADVAEKSYADGNIQEVVQDLPCVQSCPPPSATTNRLRNILLRWVGENETPPKTVLCSPSKSMEAWVVAALFPNDAAVAQGIECFNNIETRLSQQPVNQRIRKRKQDYQDCSEQLKNAWPHLVATMEEPARFQSDLLATLTAAQAA